FFFFFFFKSNFCGLLAFLFNFQKPTFCTRTLAQIKIPKQHKKDPTQQISGSRAFPRLESEWTTSISSVALSELSPPVPATTLSISFSLPLCLHFCIFDLLSWSIVELIDFSLWLFSFPGVLGNAPRKRLICDG
ncbi:hypothetical protein AABB24_002867, partial [Solanum stoloniferum]